MLTFHQRHQKPPYSKSILRLILLYTFFLVHLNSYCCKRLSKKSLCDSYSRVIVEGFSILGHWNYPLNNQCPCLFPFLLSTMPILPRISSLPGAEADTYCRIFRLVMWGRQRASVTAVLSPKPFLESLEEAEVKCYWQWSPEPHCSPVCHLHRDVRPPFLTHMCLGLCWKDLCWNVPDSKDSESGRKKQSGFEILQKLNRKVKLSCTSQKQACLPSWLGNLSWNWTEIALFHMCP